MPTPDGLTITTIHLKFVEPNSAGTPLQGTVTFTPSPAVITFPTQNVIVAGTETATLDVTGQATIDLISTDQAGEIPSGWVYSVTEKLLNQIPRTYIIALPYNSGVTVELADITPTSAAPTYLPVTGPIGPPGVITTVNGKTGSSITLNSADIGSVALTAVGAANGVASLDSGTKVPVAQLPDLSSTYILTSRIGAASGVAGLNGSSLVPSTQLDLAAATPTAIANAGAVGTATKLAREDHTHAGVALTGTQSIAGVKTWTSDQYITGSKLGVGIAASLLARTHMKSVVDEIALMVEQTAASPTNPMVNLVGSGSTVILASGKVTGDTVDRIAILASGNMQFGSGAATRDATLYRSAAGILNSVGQFASDTSAPAAASHLTRKDYVDAADVLAVHLAGTETVTGAKTFSGAAAFSGGVTLTSLSLLVEGSAAGSTIYRGRVTADTQSRILVTADGKVTWGSGSATGDTNLYRSAVGVLKTDTALLVGTDATITGNLTVTGGTLTLGSAVKKTAVGTAVAISNTATETVAASITIAANEAVVGAIYRIRVYGDVGFLASATVTWRFKWGGTGGTQLVQLGPTTASSTPQTNKESVLEAYLQVRTTGATGTVWAVLQEDRNYTQTGSVGDTQLNNSNSVVTVDTTTSNSLAVTLQWGAASASNTFIAYTLVERVA